MTSETTTGREPRKRATAALLKDGKVLLIRRVKPDREYYIFPGGGVEPGESYEEALVREISEELTLGVVRFRFLFELNNSRWPSYSTPHADQREHYFLVEEWKGVPSISGEEWGRMSDVNQYHIVWVPIAELSMMQNVVPVEGAKKLSDLLSEL